jgi:hypothetical protein
MRTVVIAILLVLPVKAQSFQRNEITFSGGITWGIASFDPYDTAVSLGATYGYRMRPWFVPEAGVFAAINPVPGYCNANGCYTFNSRFIWVPFGVRFSLPLRQDRFELSAGGGGVYQNGGNTIGYDAFGGYVKASAAMALDHGRHFWLGATPRVVIANGTYARDRWVTLTGDLSFRF